jgi:protein TonB
MVPAHADSATAAAKPDRSNANVPLNAVPASATDGEAAPPEVVPAEEKKPILGEVHLESPKPSPKRTAANSAEPDLSEEPSEGDGNALGAALGVSGKQPAAPAAQLSVGGEVKPARLISSAPPEYPAIAKAQHVSGGVAIDALIDANGRVTKMKVLSGPTLLERAAMDALRQWKYEPATLDGKAVPMHVTVTIQFRLQR